MNNNEFVLYLRVSSTQQGQSGLGLESQRAECERVTEGGNIIGEFIEVESGAKSNRPQLMSALDLARRTGATLVTSKLDRLSRSVEFVSSLMNSNVRFLAADSPDASRLSLHIRASVAEEERRLISVRTKAALAAAKARGVKLGNPNLTDEQRKLGAARGGATMREKARVFLAPILDMMKHLRAEGATYQAIADKLNAIGQRTQRGNLFSATAVQRILAR